MREKNDMNGTIKKSGRAYLFLSKLLFTILIISVYCIGRSIPLYGIDTSIYDNELDAGMLLEQSVGGDLYKCSIMALGISPYMISSILVQMIVACKPKEVKARTSAKKMNHLTVIFMLMLSITQSILRLDELSFVDEPYPFMRLVAFLEMITGACIIMWLCGRNKKYGIGGQTVLIFVNIIDGIMINLRSVDRSEAVMPVLVSVIAAFVMIFMENSEKRIPVQRISIHNIYADKNYQAIKFNPVGVMPVMFTSAAYMMPMMLVRMLLKNMPDNARVVWINDNLELSKPLGIAVYIGILFILNITLSYLIINPSDMMEQFLKSGDSLAGIHPGKDTKRYLKRHILQISFVSSMVLGGCVFASLYLQMKGVLVGTLAMLPTSAMILMGLWSNLYKEAEAIIHTDSYKTFI